MDADVLRRLRVVASALESKKAYRLTAFDVSEKTSIAEAFVLCTVGSARQAQAVADEVDRRLAAEGSRALSVEGYRQGGWVLADYGDLILHIFTEERRDFYALERLWGDAPDVTAEVRAGAA
jgi:ribosome-associated protein